MFVTVTLSTTAARPLNGTPPPPATRTVSEAPDPRRAAGTPPRPVRVSRMRAGGTEWKPLGTTMLLAPRNSSAT